MSEEGRDGHREQLQEFIESYRSKTCLWKTKSKDYHDRDKQNAAYNRLLEKYKAIDPNANKDLVVKKINNLRTSTVGSAGAAAASAEALKRRKYSSLVGDYVFEPFGVETLGPWGPAARSFYRELSKRLVGASGDQSAGLYFAQRISIAIQRGNAASGLGTLPVDSDAEEYFDA